MMNKTVLKRRQIHIFLAMIIFSSILMTLYPNSTNAASRQASIVSHTIPSYMKTGVSYPVTITIRNDGTTEWSKATGWWRLGGVNDSDPFAFTRQEIPNDQIVRPGETVTFAFNLTAPTQSGVYRTDWRMLQEHVEWFGEILAVDVSVTSTLTQNAATIMSNTIPDVMAKGHYYPVTVTVRNDGQATWSEGALYRLGGAGDKDPFAGTRQLMGSNQVGTGQTYNFTIMMKAPETLGTYTTDWQMVQDRVEWFGATLTKTVTVIEGTRNASIVAHTIPNEMETGKTYDVSITVKNTGNTSWFDNNPPVELYRLGAVGDNDPFAYKRSFFPTNVIVKPGDLYTFKFQMKAPSTSGVYVTDWRMLQEYVTWFGETLNLNIKVVKVVELSKSAIYHYDAVNRLESIKYPSGVTIYFYYDENGNLVKREKK
ncbi:NBR1-Ig-like domain-containing protein [Paenibacillus pasadenensis]|uniref:NBR1-Ig-like domain-containing protein n=1 Tax=Paenibacillus pasadenensis TaxID=217090 RepID=UPI00203D9F06|nr:NBR1-Ig-like domain-containing protein [Paenibacillus pasadenensis]MCM3748351.1 NBR1-Ig-like domain-containing protein [Paenibacillus pasadenensis]